MSVLPSRSLCHWAVLKQRWGNCPQHAEGNVISAFELRFQFSINTKLRVKSPAFLVTASPLHDCTAKGAVSDHHPIPCLLSSGTSCDLTDPQTGWGLSLSRDLQCPSGSPSAEPLPLRAPLTARAPRSLQVGSRHCSHQPSLQGTPGVHTKRKDTTDHFPPGSL